MEFLILDADRGSYLEGDVIDVQEDGFNWGTKERMSPFEVAIIPDSFLGMTVEETRMQNLQQLVNPDGVVVFERTWKVTGGAVIQRVFGGPPIVTPVPGGVIMRVF